MGIILADYQEELCAITTHDSENHYINNFQSKILLTSEINSAKRLESSFKSKFQGNLDPFYNCHGLTFASKRTGIYNDEDIYQILRNEYIPIKLEKDVLIGDVVIYYNAEESQIMHSGVVVLAEHGDIGINIKVYSKVLKAREIVHDRRECPYYFGVIKYFRINHANKFKHLS
jgi:hypothetical protein